MSNASSTLRLGVVAVHAAGWDKRAADWFRSGVTEVVRRVERRLKSEHPAIELQTKFLNSEEAGEVREWHAACAVAVLDASGFNEQLALHAGRLQGARVPVILVGDADSEGIVRRLSSGTADPVVYRSMDELFRADSAFEVELFRAVPEARIQEELVYRLWFPRETSTIWVVCPQDHDPSEYADRSSPDYTYLDNLGDQDALLELMVFLSRHYPNATIEHFSSGDLPEGHTSGNLVVVGGPGSASDISNRLCREMMDAIRSRVSYSEDCEQMSVVLDSGKSLELHAEYGDRPRGNTAEQRRIREDIGYFARFPNPLNEESTVVLVNGIHTTGVLGAARVFSERREALPNFHTVLRTGASSTGFECYFNVRVLNGHARVPSVARDQVFPVSPAGAIVSAATTSDERAISVTSSRRSVTILFIAGDRGGSQLNQIQMPNEYHGIQDALLASKHRDAISLGGAILAATRERLAQAYRFRPQVIHFVGHGNERSLSIIEDHGAIANETPLDAVQLGAALGAIQERVMLCVLNACRSENLARQLVDACVVDCAIGWPARVSDSAAIAFSNALYGALGDGRTIADAVEVAKVACGSADPVLIAADGCHSNVLVAGEADDQ